MSWHWVPYSDIFRTKCLAHPEPISNTSRTSTSVAWFESKAKTTSSSELADILYNCITLPQMSTQQYSLHYSVLTAVHLLVLALGEEYWSYISQGCVGVKDWEDGSGSLIQIRSEIQQDRFGSGDGADYTVVFQLHPPFPLSLHASFHLSIALFPSILFSHCLSLYPSFPYKLEEGWCCSSAVLCTCCSGWFRNSKRIQAWSFNILHNSPGTRSFRSIAFKWAAYKCILRTTLFKIITHLTSLLRAQGRGNES